MFSTQILAQINVIMKSMQSNEGMYQTNEIEANNKYFYQVLDKMNEDPYGLNTDNLAAEYNPNNYNYSYSSVEDKENFDFNIGIPEPQEKDPIFSMPPPKPLKFKNPM